MRLLFVFLAAVLLVPAMAEETADAIFLSLEKAGSISVKRQPLSAVLATLSEQAGRPILLDSDVAAKGTKRITCRASGSLTRVIREVARRAGLQWGVSRGQVTFYASKELKAGDEPPDWQIDPCPVREVHLDLHSRNLPPPNGWIDPVPALGDGDSEMLAKPKAKIDSKAAKRFLEAYITRIEAWHVAHSAPAPELVTWLHSNPEFRRELWPALHPRFDDAPKALAIIERLRQKDAKKLAEYKHLAIALAVVHDTPEAVVASRYYSLWGVQETQFGPTLSWEQIWEYFIDPKRQAGMVFKPKEMAWPMMVHLVDLDLAQDEIDWAWKTYGKQAKQLHELYAQVPYDYVKLGETSTALGSQPYTLENLQRLGGVCVDQAHFASRVAKVFGAPSMKCTGEGRYGGAGHAWSGFLAVDQKARAPILEFTGRYQYDFYYTGTAYDPQTRTEILDRYVALMYDGVSGRYESYRDASLLIRAALAVEATQPAVALTLVKEATRQNAYVADGWLLVMRLAGVGVLPVKDADQLYHTLLKSLAQHADLGQECLRLYLEALPANAVEPRQKLYNEAFRAFGAAQRPDLQILVRLDQLEELAAAGRTKEVILLAFETVGPNIKEGALVMPLVKQVVELSKHFAKTDPTFRMAAVRDGLTTFGHDFPKARGDDISPAWVEYQQLLEELQ